MEPPLSWDYSADIALIVVADGQSTETYADTMRARLNARHTASRDAMGRKIVANRRGRMDMSIARCDCVALRDQVVRGPRSERLDGQARIGRALCREDTAVAEKEIRDIVGTAKAIHHRVARVVAHARATDEMGIARLLVHLLRASRIHHLHRLVFAPGDQLLIVLVQVEGDFGDAQTVLVGLLGQLDAVVLPGENLA